MSVKADPCLPPIQRYAHEQLVAAAVAAERRRVLESLRARLTGYMRAAGKSWQAGTAPEMVARGEVQRCINFVNEALAGIRE